MPADDDRTITIHHESSEEATARRRRWVEGVARDDPKYLSPAATGVLVDIIDDLRADLAAATRGPGRYEEPGGYVTAARRRVAAFLDAMPTHTLDHADGLRAVPRAVREDHPLLAADLSTLSQVAPPRSVLAAAALPPRPWAVQDEPELENHGFILDSTGRPVVLNHGPELEALADLVNAATVGRVEDTDAWAAGYLAARDYYGCAEGDGEPAHGAECDRAHDAHHVCTCQDPADIVREARR